MNLTYFTKNYLMKQIKLAIVTSGIVWILHTYLMAVPNGGYDQGAPPLTYWLYTTGNALSAFVIWTSIPFILWFLTFYTIKNGKQRTIDRFTKTSLFVYQQLKISKKKDQQVIGLGALGVLICTLLLQLNGAAGFCLALLLILLVCLSSAGNKLYAFVLRCWSSARKGIFKNIPKLQFEMELKDACLFVIGCILGLLFSFILPGSYWRLGAAVLLFVTLLIVNRNVLLSRNFVFIMLLLLLSMVLYPYDLLADDGGFMECGNTWKQWITLCPDKVTVLLRSAMLSALSAPTPAAADAVTNMEEGTPIEDMFSEANSNP